MSTDKGDITYHMSDSYIHILQKVGVEEKKFAPVYDGHTPEDVIKRLKFKTTCREFRIVGPQLDDTEYNLL